MKRVICSQRKYCINTYCLHSVPHYKQGAEWILAQLGHNKEKCSEKPIYCGEAKMRVLCVPTEITTGKLEDLKIKKGGDKMSRKTIGFIVAIGGSILVLIQEQFGLSIDPVAVAAGIGAILTYIFFEAKLDLTALTKQPGKWKDPKFWLTVISAVLAAIEATFQLGIPVEAIISGLATVVMILFGVKFTKEIPY